MKAYLMPVFRGVLVLDEKGELVTHKLWKDVESAAEALARIEGGEAVEEILDAIREAREKGFDTIVLEDYELARDVSTKIKEVKVEVSPGHAVFREARDKLPSYFEKVGVKPEELREFLYNVSLALTRRKVRKAAEKRDLFIAQAISAIDDINKTINLFASRLREWYSLHFPELDDLVDDHRDYVRIVSEIGPRENFSRESLSKIGFKDREISKILDAAKTSMGADFGDFDFEAIRALADVTLKLYEVRRQLEKYIDEAMKEVAPNIRGLVGPLLGARLIALAGGLNKLAMLPASTIQVLGAEKALFRALRTGGKPPKHGVIFQYPAIHRSPRWQRGKIARALAAKLAIAARIDAFTGEYKADMLKEELENRIKEIKTLYAKPPRRERPRPRRRRRGRR